jgi:hypothetical protein
MRPGKSHLWTSCVGGGAEKLGSHRGESLRMRKRDI